MPVCFARAALVLLCLLVVASSLAQETGASTAPLPDPVLLTDPFLQLPTEDAVRVVWFTEFEGSGHTVSYGENFEETAQADTLKLSRTAEDNNSYVGEQAGDGSVYEHHTPRDIWRHEAFVAGLSWGERVPYTVTSVADDGSEVVSDAFTLAPLPPAGERLHILLTSDHQLMAMTPTNLQKVEETIGRVDAVFLAGDLINIPDRASEWFDDNRTEGRGGAFFQNLQGRSTFTLERGGVETPYSGGKIIQHAPLFPVIGNHEVMGRFDTDQSIGAQFNDPQPHDAALRRYEAMQDLINPEDDSKIREAWLRDNSFNTITYEEIFTLPDDGPAGERYYAMQFGDVYLVGLYSTRIWRSPSLADDTRGKYREAQADLSRPEDWGYGDFIFEDLAAGSEQHAWLQEVLASDAFQNARYKVVMLHEGPHGVGDNYNPVKAHPVQIIDRDEGGAISAVRYEYPIQDDILVRDVKPLLQEAGVQLVHQGHSHIWFRIQDEASIHYLETSNVGNNYGCYLEGYQGRGNLPDDPRYNAANYAAFGDPHGLEPVVPSVTAPMSDEAGNPLPCVASNDITVFSILDTGDGVVRSYYFDTREPDSEVVLFDEFLLIGE